MPLTPVTVRFRDGVEVSHIYSNNIKSTAFINTLKSVSYTPHES